MPFRPNLPGPGPFLPFQERPETPAAPPGFDPSTSALPWFVDAPPTADVALGWQDFGGDVSWSPDALAVPFDATQEPWPLSIEPVPPIAPLAAAEFGGGWLSTDADLSDVDAWSDLFTDAHRAWIFRHNALDETSDMAWLSTEADLAPVDTWDDLFVDDHRSWSFRDASKDEASAQAWLASEADLAPVDAWDDLFVDAQSAWPQLGTAEGADVSWSPDATTPPAFDATQEPWPLSVEHQPQIPGLVPADTTFTGWLASEADLAAVDAWDDLFSDAPPQWTFRSSVEDETSSRVWLAAEADANPPIDELFLEDAPRSWAPLGRTESADVSWSPDATSPPFDVTQIPNPLSVEHIAQQPGYRPQEFWTGWISSEADQAPPFDTQFYDAQAAWPALGRAESADTSWSPDSFAPAFDPTQGPWPYVFEPALPLYTQRIEQPGEFWAGWISSEADTVPPFDGQFYESQRAYPPRDASRDETSAQAWLAAEADNVAPWIDFWIDAHRSWTPLIAAESADVSWSPEAQVPPFDEATAPVWSVEHPRTEQRRVDGWLEQATAWLSTEAGPGDTVFDYFTDAQRPQARPTVIDFDRMEFLGSVFDVTQIPSPLFVDTQRQHAPNRWWATDEFMVIVPTPANPAEIGIEGVADAGVGLTGVRDSGAVPVGVAGGSTSVPGQGKPGISLRGVKGTGVDIEGG